jgi:hypothetical protein
MKSNELSNIQINKVLSNIKLYNGCYMKDELNYNNIKNGFYIINLDDNDGNGTHWCALYVDKHNNKFYFDSYGFEPPKEISKPYFYNNKIIQSLNSSSCGFFCILWILYLNKYINNDIFYTIFNFNDFFGQIDGFNDKDNNNNEIILYKLLKHFNIVI